MGSQEALRLGRSPPLVVALEDVLTQLLCSSTVALRPKTSPSVRKRGGGAVERGCTPEGRPQPKAGSRSVVAPRSNLQPPLQLNSEYRKRFL